MPPWLAGPVGLHIAELVCCLGRMHAGTVNLVEHCWRDYARSVCVTKQERSGFLTSTLPCRSHAEPKRGQQQAPRLKLHHARPVYGAVHGTITGDPAVTAAAHAAATAAAVTAGSPALVPYRARYTGLA